MLNKNAQKKCSTANKELHMPADTDRHSKCHWCTHLVRGLLRLEEAGAGIVGPLLVSRACGVEDPNSAPRSVGPVVRQVDHLASGRPTLGHRNHPAVP